MKHRTLAEDIFLFCEQKDNRAAICAGNTKEACIRDIAYRLGDFNRTSFVQYLEPYANENVQARALLDRVKRLNPVCADRVAEMQEALQVLRNFCEDYRGESENLADGCSDCPLAESCAKLGNHPLSEFAECMAEELNDENALKEANEWFSP